MVVDKIFIADTKTLSFFILSFFSLSQWFCSISTCMTPVEKITRLSKQQEQIFQNTDEIKYL